ncbi:Uncharacterised protein [Sphingobacterium spiritivorum]|uniref:N-acetyltransferase domain-containing protein n=1 Tax=Sphingobacterium spiritivorum TaxID=258 RepID=A0A380CRM9_SPHSI|nr:GNAT family N-acetyltransferase [Sphingobacterium spiritivorum]SUJ27403.1 Uncharacterised protein [Sphingobacterium spiritivorum]
MEIRNSSNGRNGVFTAYIDDQQSGQMHYEEGEDRLIIDSTEVDSHFEGLGVGKKLVLEAVDYARKNDLKIVAQCPFAKSVFDKTPAFQDVLAND